MKRLISALAVCLCPGVVAAQGLPLGDLERRVAPLEIPARALINKTFHPPDAGAGQTEFTSSLHWFRLPDHRIVGIDIVRTSDRQALRFYLLDPQGGVKALVHEAPNSAWHAFAAGNGMTSVFNALGRGKGWIAGAVRASGPDLRRVAFRLRLSPESRGFPAADLGTNLLKAGAIDYPVVRVRGYLAIDGQWFRINSRGPVTVRYGKDLPEYATVVTVPDPRVQGVPGVVIGSFRVDNLRHRATRRLLGQDRAVTYGHWLDIPRDLPHVTAMSLSPFLSPDRVIAFPTLLKYLKIDRVVDQVEHTLLGRATTTFSARATMTVPGGLAPWQWFQSQVFQVWVVGDVRGPDYQLPLGLGPTPPGNPGTAIGAVGALGRQP